MSVACLVQSPSVPSELGGRSEALQGKRDPLGCDGVRMDFARGEEVFGEDEPAKCLYRVLSGIVRTYKILSDGRRQVGEFYLPGEVFGIEVGAEHALSAEAASDVVVFAMRRGPLLNAAQFDGDLARKLWAVTLHELRRTQEHMLLLGRKCALERVVWFLMDMARRIPADSELTLPVSRQDMADYLGLTIETVSRTMTQLQDQALIELRGSRHVVLRDRKELEPISAA